MEDSIKNMCHINKTKDDMTRLSTYDYAHPDQCISGLNFYLKEAIFSTLLNHYPKNVLTYDWDWLKWLLYEVENDLEISCKRLRGEKIDKIPKNMRKGDLYDIRYWAFIDWSIRYWITHTPGHIYCLKENDVLLVDDEIDVFGDKYEIVPDSEIKGAIRLNGRELWSMRYQYDPFIVPASVFFMDIINERNDRIKELSKMDEYKKG